MNLSKAIIVYKKSAYQVYGLEKKNKNFLELIEQKHFTVASLKDSHRYHNESLQKVQQVMNELGIKYKLIYRSRRFSPKDADLIISIGGDGTFLEASRSVEHTPMLGVNSNPKSSVGMYCGIQADQLKETLLKIRSDQLKALHLNRIAIELNQTLLPTKALNDILICNLNPASSSRFILEYKDVYEEYVSSGLWVATPSGSTAAIRSAGGKILGIEDRSFQFLVREMYRSHLNAPHVSQCILHQADARLRVYSRMRKGFAFIDGAHKKIPFPTGSTLTLSLEPQALRVFAFDTKRREDIYSDKKGLLP